MKRKVVRHGKSTLIVSLPNKWVKHNGIEPGIELDVEEKGDTLIVTTDPQPQELEIEKDITGLDRTSIMYIIRGFYRQGFNTLKLTFKEPKTKHYRSNEDKQVLDVIHRETSRLIGFEVLDEGVNHCTITDLQGIKLSEYESVQRRVFFLINQTAKVLYDAAATRDKELMGTIRKKHDTITKFASYCIRLISRGAVDVDRAQYHHHIMGLLDRITDCIKYSARNILDNDTQVPKEGLIILQHVVDALATYQKLFYSYSNEHIVSINMHRYEMDQTLLRMSGENPTNLIAITQASFILDLLLDLMEARTALEYE